ncbi:MAG: hypothetical protein JWQ76_3762 [Ramlibacter sp.]|nr:hypothetical protein [Ramlibacter sp.]
MTPPLPPRLHALDNLRAIMMWLGVVLHVAAIHLAGPSPLPWRDEKRTAFADVLVAFIHAFRMPVFFILAGFFVAWLVQRHGPAGMLRNRLRRLALPFAVFWPVLTLALGGAALLYLHRMAYGSWGLDLALAPPETRGAPNTMHLWFLWLLIWFGVLTRLAWRAGNRIYARAGMLLRAIGARAWGFAVLAVPPALVGMSYPNGFLVVDGSFLPSWTEWVHHGLFFVFGIVLFFHQQELFAYYQRRWPVLAAIGLAAFIATGVLLARGAGPLAVGYAYNCATWAWSFAWIGLALRVLASRRPLLAGMAESAYWVYLVHLPLTVLFGALLFGLPLPALVKIALNIAATTLVCLATYRWWVRSRWLGVLLNGRRDRGPGLPAAASPG